MSSQSALSRQSSGDQDHSRLRCSFQATSIRQAVSIAAELRTTAADTVWVRPSRPLPPGRRDWIVTLTTPPTPLTLDVLQPREAKMLAVEHRWPGCHFLGWMTCETSTASSGPKDWPKDDAAVAGRRSQRGLVMASLLRCPAVERRGSVDGRAVRR